MDSLTYLFPRRRQRDVPFPGRTVGLPSYPGTPSLPYFLTPPILPLPSESGLREVVEEVPIPQLSQDTVTPFSRTLEFGPSFGLQMWGSVEV